MNLMVKFLLVICLFSVAFTAEPDPDEQRTFDEMVIAHEYPLEVHYCLTSDSYYLKIYRIPGEKGSHPIYPNNKPPVLLGHGLADSSDSWIVNEEHLAPAYVFANLGFDVWFLNIRGNKHSKVNKKIDPKKKAFWDFSFHETGKEDVTCVIDMIKSTTGKDKVTYVGHSQGGSQIFALCSLNPDFCKKNLTGIIALAPAVFIHNTRSAFLKELTFIRLDKLISLFGIYHLYESRTTINKFSSIICELFHKMCDTSTKFISEDDPTDNNEKRDQVSYNHYPAGASTKALIHFATLIRNKNFVDIKGKAYPLGNINVPVHLFGGEHDKLVTIDDINILKGKLSTNGVLAKYVQLANHGHLTFLLSKGQSNYIEELVDSAKKLAGLN